jgi:capsular polysaccharide export protein
LFDGIVMNKIIFVANSGKRYRYYRLLAQRMKGSAQVIFSVYPSLALLLGIFQPTPIDQNLLMASHLRRQKINYPMLARFPWLWRIYCYLAYVTERSRFHHYYQLFLKLDCEALGIWNGQKQPYLTMVKAAELAGKRVLFFENGLLPNTTTVDYMGVNAFNSLPRNADFYLNLEQLPVTQSTIKLVKRDPHKKRQVSDQKLDNLNFNYIFIPFQVPADSQIVIHSSWVHSMEQLFHLVRDARNKLMLQGETKLPYLVFKEHPSWPGSFEHLYQLDEFCLFANENDTQYLIEHANAVITINSTVGLESLLLGKKVITLGNACYNIEQLVLHATNENEFFEAFASLPNWQYNEELRQKFINFIASVYCIPDDWQQMLSQTSEAHLDAIYHRIFETDRLAQFIQLEKER